MPRRRRGRPKLGRVRTTLYFEQETFGKLEMYLLDPRKGKLKHGALSLLINALANNFLRQLEQSDRDPIEIFRAYGIDLIDVETEESEEDEHDYSD